MNRMCLVAFGALCVAGSACSPLHMAPPASVQEAMALPATGRSRATGALVDEDFELGTYGVVDVSRKATTSVSRTRLFTATTRKRAKAGFSYALRDGETTLKGECLEYSRSTERDLGDGLSSSEQNSASFQCRCGSGDDSDASLDLGERQGENREGLARVGDAEFSVHALYELDNGQRLQSTVGYEFARAAGAGAVEVVSGGGRAWLPKDLAPNQARGLVCLYAGLMLFTPTSESMTAF